jgi:hypothetical protein
MARLLTAVEEARRSMERATESARAARRTLDDAHLALARARTTRATSVALLTHVADLASDRPGGIPPASAAER